MSEIHTFPLGCIVGDIEAMSECTHLLLGEGQILSHRCIHEVMFCWKLCLYLEKMGMSNFCHFLPANTVSLFRISNNEKLELG